MHAAQRRPGRAMLASAAAVAAMAGAAFGISACSRAVAENQAAVTTESHAPSAAPMPQTPTPSAVEPSASPQPPTKQFCRDLAKLLNSKAAHELVAAEVNQNSDEAHAALLSYIPTLQHFIDHLDAKTPNNIRSTLGQFNTDLQNKILQRTISADDLYLIKYTDDDIRHYAVATCGQRLTY